MPLYIVNQSPFTKSSLESCLAIFDDDTDQLLLIEDGVTALLPGHKCYDVLTELSGVHALQDDIASRGLTNHIRDWLSPVDYLGFVDLSEKHNKIISWT